MFALVCSVLFLGLSAQAMRAESESSSTIRLVSTVTRNGLTADRAPGRRQARATFCSGRYSAIRLRSLDDRQQQSSAASTRFSRS